VPSQPTGLPQVTKGDVDAGILPDRINLTTSVIWTEILKLQQKGAETTSTLSKVQSAVTAAASSAASTPATTTSQVFTGPRSQKTVTPPVAGSIFVETGNGTLTYEWIYQGQFLSGIQNWVLVYGQVSVTQSQIVALTATLGAGDAGLNVNVTDFAHLLVWSGSALGWGPGETGGNQIAGFLEDPATGWNLCDGSTVNYLKSDGTTASVTLPNLVGVGDAAYLKFGTPASATPNAAVVPLFAGTPFSNVIDHTHTVTVTDPGHAHTIAESGGAGAVSELLPVAAQSASSASTSTATTGVTAATANPAGGVASITPAGTISNMGEPRNLVLRPFFRL
jgi:hypothetical protein